MFKELCPIWNRRLQEPGWNNNLAYMADIKNAAKCIVGEAWGYHKRHPSQIPVYLVYDRCDICKYYSQLFTYDIFTQGEKEKFATHFEEKHEYIIRARNKGFRGYLEDI